MDQAKVHVGMRVAVNDLPDGQVYTVKELNGVNAHLEYVSAGYTQSGGWIDVCALRKPTAAQERNAAAQAAAKPVGG